METLKFVITAVFYPPYHLGGDANHVRYLAEALAAQGHEVHVEYSPAALALKRGRPDLDEAGDGGVIGHPIKAATARLQPLSAWIFGAPPSVRRHHRQLVDGVRPDIIHYHNLSLLGLDLINVPSAALKMYTAHDYWVRCPRNDLFKFNQRLCEKPTCLTCLTISGKPPQLWRYLPSGLTPFDALDVAIAPSDFLRGMIAPYLRAPLVAFEALAWGTPILASETGALPEILHGGMCGRTIQPTAEGILAGIEEFEAGDLAHGQRRAARMAYETYHTPAKYLENYHRLIEATWERKTAMRTAESPESAEMTFRSRQATDPISPGEPIDSSQRDAFRTPR